MRMTSIGPNLASIGLTVFESYVARLTLVPATVELTVSAVVVTISLFYRIFPSTVLPKPSSGPLLTETTNTVTVLTTGGNAAFSVEKKDVILGRMFPRNLGTIYVMIMVKKTLMTYPLCPLTGPRLIPRPLVPSLWSPVALGWRTKWKTVSTVIKSTRLIGTVLVTQRVQETASLDTRPQKFSVTIGKARETGATL